MFDLGYFGKILGGPQIKIASPDLAVPRVPEFWSPPSARPKGKKGAEEDEPTQELLQAAEWLRTADALVIGSGAGLSAYGGLPTLTGPDAWETYASKPLEEVLCNQCFLEDPRLAWGLWVSLLRSEADWVIGPNGRIGT
eukprot:s1924_g7.t1